MTTGVDNSAQALWTTYVEAYLSDRSLAWSPATLKSETSRLRKLLPLLAEHGLNGLKIYGALKTAGLKPYTIQTTFIRLCDMEKFLHEEAPANIRRQGVRDIAPFMRRQARLFKGSYQRVRTELGLQEAIAKIDLLEDEEIRAHAKFILSAGLRFSESQTLEARNGSQVVTGKGGKVREVFSVAPTVHFKGNHGVFYRALKKVGIKPHELRKVAATELSRAGMNITDLQLVFGWSSPKTASIYIQESKAPELRSKIRGVLKV